MCHEPSEVGEYNNNNNNNDNNNNIIDPCVMSRVR